MRKFSSSGTQTGSFGSYSGSTYNPRSSGRGQKIASLRYFPNGKIMQLEAPYDNEFTDTLKTSLPTNKRAWDPANKCWIIAADQFDKLTHILDKFFSETVLLDFPAHEVEATNWSKLYLIPNTPLEIVRAVYKALAMLYHPDRGGDTAKMQEINLAYKAILGDLKNGTDN